MSRRTDTDRCFGSTPQRRLGLRAHARAGISRLAAPGLGIRRLPVSSLVLVTGDDGWSWLERGLAVVTAMHYLAKCARPVSQFLRHGWYFVLMWASILYLVIVFTVLRGRVPSPYLVAAVPAALCYFVLRFNLNREFNNALRAAATQERH